jgi:hypothetical protein
VVDSYQSAIKALKPPIETSAFFKSADGIMKKTVKRVGAIDGFLKIHKGTKILFLEDGDLAYELRQGQEVRAYVQSVKGVLLVASGVLGVLGAVPGTAAAALVGGPVGLAIAVGGMLVVALVDEVLDATQPYEKHVSEFRRSLDEAVRVELGHGQLRVIAAVQACVQKCR